jgi:hypothetical protein
MPLRHDNAGDLGVKESWRRKEIMADIKGKWQQNGGMSVT